MKSDIETLSDGESHLFLILAECCLWNDGGIVVIDFTLSFLASGDIATPIVARLEQAHADWATGLADTPILPALRSTLVDIHGDTVQLFF